MDERVDCANPGTERTDRPPRYVDPDELGKLLAGHRAREGLSLEQVSRQVGISATTLWRWERKPADRDPHKLRALAHWLGVQLDPAVVPLPLPLADPIDHSQSEGTVEFVEAHLRADRNLDPKTAAALARMFRAAYEQFAPSRATDREDTNG